MGATWLAMTASMSWVGDRLEAWSAAPLFAVFEALSLDRASALGGALARRVGPFLGVSKLARRNLSRAFPELSEAEIERIVTGMWDNLGRVAAEYPHLRKSACSTGAGGLRRMASSMSIGRSPPVAG